MLSILNYSSVLFYELTPDEIELAGDASVKDHVLDLEDEASDQRRIDLGLQKEFAAGLLPDQFPQAGLQRTRSPGVSFRKPSLPNHRPLTDPATDESDPATGESDPDTDEELSNAGSATTSLARLM